LCAANQHIFLFLLPAGCCKKDDTDCCSQTTQAADMPLRRRFKGSKQPAQENVETRQDEPKRGIGEKVKFLTSLFGKKRRKDKRASSVQVMAAEDKVSAPVVDKGKTPIRPENNEVTAPVLDKGKEPIRPENINDTNLTVPAIGHRHKPLSEAPIPVEFEDSYDSGMGMKQVSFEDEYDGGMGMKDVPFDAAADLTNEDINIPTELSTRESSVEDVSPILTVKVGTPSENDCKPQRGVSNASSQVAEIVQVTPDGSVKERCLLSTMGEEPQLPSARTSVNNMGNTLDTTKSDLLGDLQTEGHHNSIDDLIETPTSPTKTHEAENVVQEPSTSDEAAEMSDDDFDDCCSRLSTHLPRSTSMPGTWFSDEDWARW
jgi:hypothetical protein